MKENLKESKYNKPALSSEVPTNQQQQEVDQPIFKGLNWKPNLNLNDLEKSKDSYFDAPNLTEEQRKQLGHASYIEKVPEFTKSKVKELITLKGITTSQINQALKANNPYPARVFLKVENQEQDIPIFFRIKEKDYQIKPCSECNYPKKGNLEKQTNCQTKEVQHQVEEVWIRPKIKKGSYLQVEGHFDSPKNGSDRPSFTATSYKLLNQEFNQQIETYERK